jgi:hypothetical protein
MMMMMLNLIPAILLALSGSVTVDDSPDQSPRRPKRSYAERTLARRKRTNTLIESILPPDGFGGALEEIELPELEAPSIDWSTVHVDLDPQKGGNLRGDTPRSRRKRLQVEAFLHLCKELLPGVADDKASTIVDAGSGAGNLAIPLAGLLQSHVLAIDMNQIALDRLEDRSREIPNCDVSTLCADLATAVLPDACSIVCSLHACGAATDMAIRMSTQYRLPFVMSPCCTGKANIDRVVTNKHGLMDAIETYYQKSAAPVDITYPRSQWLHRELQGIEETITSDNPSAAHYVTLAKVADVGLGPQTPIEQIRHQRLAKYAVELDRLMDVVESHNYVVQMFKLKHHEGYGKTEIYIGVPKEHPAASRIGSMTSLCN